MTLNLELDASVSAEQEVNNGESNIALSKLSH